VVLREQKESLPNQRVGSFRLRRWFFALEDRLVTHQSEVVLSEQKQRMS